MAKAPYLCDMVGSFLRPQELKDAREAFSAGTMTKEVLTEIENKSIVALVDKLASLGYEVTTDGEYRRGWYHSDFLAGLKGVNFSTYKMELFGEEMWVGSTTIASKIEWNPDHPFMEHFKFLKELTDARGMAAKLTIPGPNMVLLDTMTTDQENFYGKDVFTMAKDFVVVYQDAIKSIYDAGCRYLQIDDPVWVSLCDANFCKKMEDAGFAVADVKKMFYDTAADILSAKPADMDITLHLCQGNMRSKKFYDTTYDEITETIFSLPFDGYFMEYDDEKYCNFELLKDLKPNQKVALGILSTRYSDIEDKGEMIDRVKRALQYVSKEQICLTTQCGFASTAEGNIITEEAQWTKMALLQEIAAEVLA